MIPKIPALICILILTLTLLPLTHPQNTSCHYTCNTCSSPAYYHCTTCRINRGSQTQPLVPFAGMCYCSSQADQSITGQCVPDSTFSVSNRSLIWAFIILTLLLSFFMLAIRGFRYYFIKTIEDIQELSLIVYINMYFPQHFDLLLTQMYRFNISSFLFQSIASGGLFEVGIDGSVISLDGMNVPGKYNLLFKTANFFSNMFTWTIVLLILIGVMLLVRFLRNRFANENQTAKVQKIGEESMNASQADINNAKNNESFVMSQNQSELQQNPQLVRQKYQITKINRKHPYNYTLPNMLTKLHHILNFNFLITFFYLSLIELNINIFTQMKNLSFVSGFAGFGSIMCIVFFGLQIAAIAWLFYKCKNELQKPEWMLDHSYTAMLYLIRINYKSLSRYFFFLSALKKIFFALIISALYNQPEKAIQAFSILQMIFVCISLYIQPFQKRYLRIHFYMCQVLKLFLFLSLINFVEKYKEYTTLTDVTQVFFTMMGFIFGFHFFVLLFCLAIERKSYWYALKRVYYKLKRAWNKEQKKSQDQLKNDQMVIGYFHYVWEKDEEQVKEQTEKPKMEDISKDLKELELSGSINMSEVDNKQEEQQMVPQEKQRKYFFIYKNYQK